MAKEVGSLVLLVFTADLTNLKKVPQKYQKNEGF